MLQSIADVRETLASALALGCFVRAYWGDEALCMFPEGDRQ